ncbi:MAG: bifunctional diaminohydroxyphosphoribosylaminopyrimidine deaminase/5-amino-6-(5-phosphoribosylamino)uracil reductase RibD [Candidatus Aminicenantaceae bacterium]
MGISSITNCKDASYMYMAYSLAEKAKGWASPNPYVGCIILKNGAIVGYGFHEKPGKLHAEAVAIQKAGSQVQNSTLYTTLEPCLHWGRTPPCVDKIIEAKPKRVVVSALDPNPLVYKKGVKKLKDAGINVLTGLLEQINKKLNETYIKYITRKQPFVLIKAASSFDGKIATKNFSSQWISSLQTREYTHLIRAEYDAIMTGINTIIKDNPQLTIRHSDWTNKKLTRIILDSSLRLPPDSKIISTLSKGKILIFTKKNPPLEKAKQLQRRGVQVIPLQKSDSSINLKEVLNYLGQIEISSVLVEGGGQLTTSFIQQKLADKILLIFSPKLIGGEKAPSFYDGKGINHIQDAYLLKDVHSFKIGEDTIMEGYF